MFLSTSKPNLINVVSITNFASTPFIQDTMAEFGLWVFDTMGKTISMFIFLYNQAERHQRRLRHQHHLDSNACILQAPKSRHYVGSRPVLSIRIPAQFCSVFSVSVWGEQFFSLFCFCLLSGFCLRRKLSGFCLDSVSLPFPRFLPN